MQDKEAVITVRGVHKRFGTKDVHVGVSLDVYRGEILTLLGGSGSGKSVLLRSFIGLDKPDKGEILVNGVDVTQLSEEELIPIRKKVAYVFQYGALFDSLTVEENLSYPLIEHTDLSRRQIRKKVSETLEKIGMSGSEKLLPSDLSGGMQKRVGVARSIIMDPEVILYDEPTSGLDPYNTRQILSIVDQLKGHGATSVLVTHDVASLFRVTDRVVFLKKGRIAATGTVDEVRKSANKDLKNFIEGEST